MIRHVRLLEQASADNPAREIIIGKEEFLIGRGGDCDLQLPDEAVSRHHCLIRIQADQADVSDMGSANGTFLNGERIIQQAALETGDKLRVGPRTFVIDFGKGLPENPAATVIDPNKKTLRIRPG